MTRVEWSGRGRPPDGVDRDQLPEVTDALSPRPTDPLIPEVSEVSARGGQELDRAACRSLSVAEPAPFALSHLIQVGSTDELQAVFAAARGRRNEGLMVNDPGSSAGVGTAVAPGGDHDGLRARW
jgi:hypothetical protein